MKRSLPLFLSLSLVVVLLCSCSGLKGNHVCTSNCTTNAQLSLTLIAKPPSPTANLAVLSFTATVTEVSLVPSSGSTQNITLNSAVEFTRLESDSAFLGTISVPAGTYNSISVAINGLTVTFCTQPTPGSAGCSGAITQVTGAASTPSISTSPFPLTLVSNQTEGLAVKVDLGAALTLSGQTVSSVSFSNTGVFSVSTLPGTTDLASGQLSHIDDFVGVVTQVNTSTKSATIKSATRGTITATANSSTIYDSINCSAQTFSACLTTGFLVSVDAILNSDGTLSLRYVDPLDSTADDIIEGITTATPSSSTKFTVVTNDYDVASSSSVLSGAINLGDAVDVTLSGVSPFAVDSHGLSPIPATFAGSQDASVILPGQTLFLRVTAFTAKSGTTHARATVDFVGLRFSRLAGLAGVVASPSLSASNTPAFYGFASTMSGEVTLNETVYDNLTALTGVTNGDTVSVRALYFGPSANPNLVIAAVRKN